MQITFLSSCTCTSKLQVMILKAPYVDFILFSSKEGTNCISPKQAEFKFRNKSSFLFPRRELQVINYFYLLTNTIRTTLSLSQHRSLTGYWWARLRVASNHTIHANAASADIGLPGLSCQKNISFVVFAVTGHALIA